MKYLKKGMYGTLLVGALALAGCTDTWNAHYDVDNERPIADKTLWQEITARPELAEFTKYLKLYGYDKLLDGQQMFTVFAPVGELDVNSIQEKNIERELVKNHIARFAFSANSEQDGKVAVLNEKIIDFLSQGEGYLFGDAHLIEKNIIAKNGVLHTIDSRVPFLPNVWEFLDSDTTLSLISEYMHSFDTLVVDVEASVPGQIVDGKQEYVDSVTENQNPLLIRSRKSEDRNKYVGSLNDEDSIYTMIVPTNEAWNKAYAKVSSYYTYYNKDVQLADSMTRTYARQAIINDLVFSHTMQGNVRDSLVSTRGNVFYTPFEYLLSGFSSMEDGQVCSNGQVFVVDSLRHHPWESWHQEIVVEAENSQLYEEPNEKTTGVSSHTLEVNDSLYGKVSKHRYLEIYPMSTGQDVKVVFNVRNVLSASYTIKVVLLPQTMKTDKIDGVKPNKLTLSLNYKDAKGANKKVDMDYVAKNPYAMDTIQFVYEDKQDLNGNGDKKELLDIVPFPICNYEEAVVSTKFTIESDVSRKETETYSRTVLVDCIILEPVKE